MKTPLLFSRQIILLGVILLAGLAIDAQTLSSCPVTITASPGTTVCPGTSVTLMAAGATSYIWANDTNNTTATIVVNPTTTTTYTVSGTTGTCTDPASITITVSTPPTVSIAVTGTTATATASDGTPPYTYLWGDGTTGPIYSGLTPGLYTVTVTDAVGCSASASVNYGCTVTITASATTVCPGTNVTLTASGTTSYHWNDSSQGNQTAASIVVTPTTTTTYTVTGTTGTCVDVASITITVNSPTVSIAVSGNGATANVSGGTPPYMYLWSSGQTAASITGLTPGLYTVTVTDAAGCSASASVTYGGPCSAAFTLYPDSTDAQTYWAVNAATGAMPLSYVWDWGDGSPTDNTAIPSHTYTVPNTYTITLTITDGSALCTDVVMHQITVTSTTKEENPLLSGTAETVPLTVHVIFPTTSGVTSNEVSNHLSLYPNPASDLTSVSYSLSHASAVQITVYDVMGRNVAEVEQGNRQAGVHYVDGTGIKLPAGTYWLKLDAEGKTAVTRLVLVK